MSVKMFRIESPKPFTIPETSPPKSKFKILVRNLRAIGARVISPAVINPFLPKIPFHPPV